MTGNLVRYKFIFTLAVCGLMLLNPVVFGQSDDKRDPLRRYTSCKTDSDLYIKEVKRRNKDGGEYRAVKTASGEQKVSVTDGYRVMFAYSKARYYFANVKIERSKVEEYENDKRTVIEHIEYLPFFENAPTPMIYRGEQLVNGYEVYGADMDVIDKGGVIGIYVIFSNTDNVIITIYFLNQGREARRYNDIQGFRMLRDDFLNRYTGCIKKASL